MTETVLVERDGARVTLRLNRPEVLNAFNIVMGEQLLVALQDLKHDSRIRVVVLSGMGQAFCAGGDIKLMAQSEDAPTFFRRLSQLVHDAILTIRSMPQPVLAVLPGPVSGVAFGLVCSCDLRIASESTTFHAGTTRLGLAPNGGVSYFLPRLIGRGRAEHFLLTAEKITAQQAATWGLVDSVVSSDELEAESSRWCEQLTAQPAGAQEKFKELLWNLDRDLADHLDRERDAISATAATADFREGIAAFLEKREPRFRGE